ncbi:PEP-CTERM sorting domain-containing protein [Propionivibrio sp.]|uniref:PEP-CTERM sorting domain-containing protein n=1 Tax=Propionivibrio sp. TaxID=2212460 RepID=UPI003BEFC666
MKLSQKLVAVAVAAAATAFAGSASAIPIVATFNVVGLGTFTADTGDVTTANTITDGTPNSVAAIVGNNIGLVSGQSVSLTNIIGVNLGSVFTKEFSTPEGTFLETMAVTLRTPGPTSLGILAQGNIVQTVQLGATVFDPTAIFWSAAYTQNAGPGAQINASFNNSTVPPTQVPEPATLALVGLAITGLGLTRRRRSV